MYDTREPEVAIFVADKLVNLAGVEGDVLPIRLAHMLVNSAEIGDEEGTIQMAHLMVNLLEALEFKKANVH